MSPAFTNYRRRGKQEDMRGERPVRTPLGPVARTDTGQFKCLDVIW